MSKAMRDRLTERDCSSDLVRDENLEYLSRREDDDALFGYRQRKYLIH